MKKYTKHEMDIIKFDLQEVFTFTWGDDGEEGSDQFSGNPMFSDVSDM